MARRPTRCFPNPGDESAVAKAWESFLNGDEPPCRGACARSSIGSWQRCVRRTGRPHARSGPQPVSDQDLYLLRERQRELLEAERAGDGLRARLPGGDRHPDGAGRRQRHHPHHRGRRARAAVRPRRSGSCPASAGARPVRHERHRHGAGDWASRCRSTSAEHFCAGIKRWTCSATVVRHPADGEIVGVIDVSGLSSHLQPPDAWRWWSPTASRIESRLAMTEMERRFRLLDQAMGRWLAGAGRDWRGAVRSPRLPDSRPTSMRRSPSPRPAARSTWPPRAALPELGAGGRARAPGRSALPAWIRPEWLEPLIVKGEHLGTLLVCRLAAAVRSAGASGGSRG